MPATRAANDVDIRTFGPIGLTQTAGAIAGGTVSCVQVVERCLGRAAATESRLSAWLRIDAEEALRQAWALDRELAESGPRSPLHGIPVAVKDIIDVAGLPTTAASRVMDPEPAARDAEIVAALRSLGAIILGKANTHEFAYGATTPPTRNPADPSRLAGGSSGGSAAAVGAGSAILGIGSDTGGSARLPASLCGVAGWRPIRSPEITLAGVVSLASEFDEWGLLASSAADLAQARLALRGVRSEPIRASSVIVPASLEHSLPGLVEDVERVFALAVDRLRAGGLGVIQRNVSSFEAWRQPRMAIQMRQVLGYHENSGWWPSRRHRYGDEVRANLEIAEARKNEDLTPYRQKLRMLDAEIDALLDISPVLVVPTVPVIAPRADDVAQMRRKPGERHPIVGLLSLATLPFSRPDLTSLTVPAGSTEQGLPIGVQFVSRDESALFATAARYEELAS